MSKLSLTNDLNLRIAVYKPTLKKTDLGDNKPTVELYKKVWASIRTTGSSLSTQPADMTQAKLAHSIIVRANALSEIAEDMFFVYKDRRYNIDTWRPHYMHPDRLEIICTMDNTPFNGGVSFA